MIVRHCRAWLCAIAASFTLGSCATMTETPRTETISWSVGPCFGFCPVYSVQVVPSGLVTFDGERHTAVLGRRSREAGPGAFRSVAEALFAYRPGIGMTAQTECDQRISDQSTTRIVWKGSDGTVTTLEHDRGCRSKRNDALNVMIQGLPARLKIEAWTRQTTRPGAPRG